MKTLVLAMALVAGPGFAGSETYGEPLTKKAATLKLSEISKVEGKSQKTFLVKGKVEQVCEKKGCWMTLNDGSGTVRISFKDYSFFVPMKLKGQNIRAEGIVETKERSVADLRHLAKDGGASAAEIEKITKAQTIHEFVAHGVERI